MVFDTLTKAFMMAPMPIHFDPDRPIIIENNPSNYVSARILSQHDQSNLLRPLAYSSKKHSPAECNYEKYNQELLAIIHAFDEWHPELEGAKYPISVLTDHKNLEYFITKKDRNRRQARWL